MYQGKQTSNQNSTKDILNRDTRLLEAMYRSIIGVGQKYAE